jgi:putative PIN family toxin of toxin-antitoxin system
MAKMVVDANVIISAAFGGKPLEAFIRALEDHEVYLSEAFAQELMGVLSGLSKKLSADQFSFIHEKIQQLLTLAAPTSLSTHVVLSWDAKDDHYLSLCKEARADYLITGDKDLLSISQDKLKANRILCRIVTSQKFLESIS